MDVAMKHAVSADEMRLGLRRLGKAVVIITAADATRPYAMVATAVSELSLDPPSMLICVNQAATLHTVLQTGADFCINILRTDQVDLAVACSGGKRGVERFEDGTWADAHNGAPRLVDAQSSFVCKNVSSMPFGTHSIFIGEVEDVFTHGEVDPLIYVDGDYVTPESID